MRDILEALIEQPPSVFVIQTRGPLVLRDRELLAALARRTRVRISFSVTTNREAVRRLYEPHCASIPERFEAMRKLREAGLDVYATLAPLLPCDPEELAGTSAGRNGGRHHWRSAACAGRQEAWRNDPRRCRENQPAPRLQRLARPGPAG